jgi:gamma-glutamyltranspeptidase/glutathione hydrolase
MIQMSRFTFLFLWISASMISAIADDVPSSRPTTMSQAVIASYNREARDAGKQIFEEGGNAFDAFVAATLVEYVVAPGVTSLAGPLNALVYQSETNEKFYLDAELNHVVDLEGIWSEGEPDGKGVMVPGALHGLESIHVRFGKLPWSRLVEPATTLAREGFPIDAIYAATIEYRAEALKSTPYGRTTFFRNGKPLQPGERLVQPELAVFLEEVAQRGSAAMYRGAWGERCIETVRSRGGRMELQDLHNYRSRWLSPRHIRYRDYDVYGASGRSYGGAWSLLALKTLEHFDLSNGPHFSESTDRLEVMVRVAQTVWNEAWLYETENLDDDAKVESYLAAPHAAAVWERVRQELPADLPHRRGNHSYHIVVVDRDGNAITGTNTINSLPWGDGAFVDGVPLTNTFSQVGNKTRPGERRLTPMSSHLVFRDGRLRVVSGTFNSSLLESGFQILVNAIDFQLPAKHSATLPRFGTFSFDDEKPESSSGKMWLDPAISKGIVDQLAERGLEFEQQSSFIDTGSGAIAILADDGSVDAALLPLVGHESDEPTFVDRRGESKGNAR